MADSVRDHASRKRDGADSEAAVSTAKTFRACRYCRRLKMRCEGSGAPPCRRCASSKVECIYDAVDSSGKRKRAQVETLREDLQRLQRHLESLSDARTKPSISNSQADANAYDASSPEKQELEPDHREEGDLSPEQLSAPVSTVHDLAPLCNPQASPNHAHLCQPGSPAQESSARDKETLRGRYEDVLSRSPMDEDQARRLFNLYMTGSNPYLPIFEPTLDTFDKIRRTSSFLFAAILSIAGRTEEGTKDTSSIFHQEANKLAGESLFDSPPMLETAQALLIVAAWSETSWFALSHAVNLALDLGLDKSPSKLAAGKALSVQKQQRLLQETRTWLIIYHLEREIAFGTARKSRLAQIKNHELRLFREHVLSRHLDLRFLSIVDLVQLRERWQNNISGHPDIARDAVALALDAKKSFSAWETFWDQKHKSREYDSMSFQRLSLTVQRKYATILVYCEMLSELQRQKSGGGRAVFDAFHLLSVETLHLVTDHLDAITEMQSFKWQLKFSPTYSALTIAFSAALALTLARSHLTGTGSRSTVRICRRISSLLSEYPNQKFHLLVESFLKRMPTRVAAPESSSTQEDNGRAPIEKMQATIAFTPTHRPDAHPVTQTIDTAVQLPSSSVQGVENSGAMSTTGILAPSSSLDTAIFPDNKELEAILGLPAESWFFMDPFSIDEIGFGGITGGVDG